MAPNRILYLFALVASASFYFASNMWESWVVVLVVLALPWVSLIMSLPAIVKVRLQASLPSVVEEGQNENFHIRVTLPRAIPTPEVRIRINLRTRDTQTDVRYLSRLGRTDGILAAPTSPCGFLAPELHKGRVYDYLGLWAFRLRAPTMPVMVILPKPVMPDPMPNLEQLLHQQLKPKFGGGYSEIHEHRPYRPGDPVKDIHWKLSLKTDDLVVREAMEPISRRVILAVHTPRGPVVRGKTLGGLRYLSERMLDHGVTHTILWMDGDSVRQAEVKTGDDLIEALCGVCTAPEDSRPLPKRLSEPSDWLCYVGEREVAK